MKSIAWDYAHRISEKVTELANEYSSIVVLENLNKLRSRVNGNSAFNKKLFLWFYGRIQFTVGYEALERS
ncbi:MAG: IS200/IS605 family accessory protein TnpB-related protein [Candidatus Nezhaarchaeales archaeon]|nr:MAG: hypothetical protein DSO06_01885 [Candidatus Nezhaarchaeota archaeon WYZ-LMO8]TDA36441.1 MAG: hypothetical protein DSO05_03635 [Candidatus Nezhaarchaeota archaeon WYZ-LMO7]